MACTDTVECFVYYVSKDLTVCNLFREVKNDMPLIFRPNFLVTYVMTSRVERRHIAAEPNETLENNDFHSECG